MLKAFCDLCTDEQAFTVDAITNKIFRRKGDIGIQIIIGRTNPNLTGYYRNGAPIEWDHSVHLCHKCASDIILNGETYFPPKEEEAKK